MNKKILISLFLAVLIIGTIFFYSPVIFQEGNPWPQIKGISQLSFGDNDIVQLVGGDNKFMSKSENGQVAIKDFMKNKGYGFVEQMGSGYFFEATTGKSAIVTHKYYSQYFSLWTVTENSGNPKANDELWITTTTDADISFQYPKDLVAKYISQVNWPPQVKIDNRKFDCKQSGMEIQSGGQTELRLVDDRSYCVTKESEGVAGSVYTNYTYAFPQENKIGVITFSLRFVQCQNYDESKAFECETERSAFDVDGLADRIAQSVKIKDNDLTVAEQLKVCLTKSDTASHEKCQQLLLAITNYDECVGAGFSIMKSNPPQCATPDGRIFVQLAD